MQKITDNVYVLIIIAMLGTLTLVMSFLFILLRNQNKLSKQKQMLQAAEIEHHKQLLRAVIESEESERRRIGRDLHDDVGTALSGLRITIERFTREAHSGELSTRLATVSKTIIDKIIADVRNISHNLSPEILSMQTLSEAIEELCGMVNDGGQIAVSLTNEAGDILDGLELTAAMAIYRILEELMTNTIRHAEAGHIAVSVKNEAGWLLIDYCDNGKGMPATGALKKGRGLQNIESRLGILKASYNHLPAPGPGYCMHIKIPLPVN